MSKTGRSDCSNFVNMSDEEIPKHLQHWPGLFVRYNDTIVAAPPEDVTVAKSYPRSPDKGPLINGARLTILTRQGNYEIGEPIRIIHVFEAVEPGRTVYVMGPKTVFGEYVNEILKTLPAPDDVLAPHDYEGMTIQSPAADYNYEITSYTFRAPGTYQIQWRLGELESNVLNVIVGD